LKIFIKTAEQLSSPNQKIHLVIIGDPNATTYGYKRIFLEKKYGKGNPITFIEHLFKTHKLSRKHFTLTGKLPYPEYSNLLHKIDLFLYPVQYGSGNWGLWELLIRGCTVLPQTDATSMRLSIIMSTEFWSTIMIPMNGPM